MFISSQIDQFLLSCFKIHPDIRLLSLDMGYKHIGLAYSATSKIAVPLPSISGETKLWIAALNSVIKEKNPNGLILGWPLNDDETLSKGCQKFKDRMTAWRQQASAFFPILLWNERNTSWAVDQERHAIYKTSQKNSRITSHSLCARMILEEVLNCIQIL